MLSDDKGFILITSLIVIAILTLLGVTALNLSNTQSMITKNRQEAAMNLYNTEAGIIDAIEKSNLWFTDSFIQAQTSEAKAVFNSNIIPAYPVKIEIRKIDNGQNIVNGLSAFANDLPSQPHISPPPLNSGFGMKNFEVRKYGITASSNNMRIQVGAYKVFNK